MSILVTGGTGLLGTQIVRALVTEGESPVAFDVSPRPHLLSDVLDRVRIVVGDATQLPELIGAVRKEKVEAIIHTAALLTIVTEANPYRAYRVNLGGTLEVLEAARLGDVERVVYTSSAAVYGHTPADARMDENYPANPVTFYGWAKLASEGFGRLYAKTYGFDFTALRLGGVLYGPGPMGSKATIVIREMVEKSLRGEPVRLPVAPDTRYRFLYAGDAAKAHLLGLRKAQPHPVYNFSSPPPSTVREIADAVSKVIPSASISFGPAASATEASRYAMTYEHGIVDDALARAELGYRPEYEITRGIQETVDWFRAGLAGSARAA
jgi:nucleoside-diphosphate-sugar epimerase